jgi:hypothetical protein
VIVFFVDEADPVLHGSVASVIPIGVQCEASGSGDIETAEHTTDAITVCEIWCPQTSFQTNPTHSITYPYEFNYLRPGPIHCPQLGGTLLLSHVCDELYNHY